MVDEPTFDRRSLLRRASAAGLVGLSGFGTTLSRARREGDGREGGNAAEQEDGDDQDGPIEYMQAVLPAGYILDADLVYRIVVVGGRIRPGERPPPLCFPEGEKQWRARRALVIKPTEETGVFGDDDVDEVNRTRAFIEEPVEPGSVWRIAGGEFCDGYAQVTIHELPPQLSEHFSTDMLDVIEEFEQNRTVEDETEVDQTTVNVTVDDETTDNETDGNA